MKLKKILAFVLALVAVGSITVTAIQEYLKAQMPDKSEVKEKMKVRAVNVLCV